MEKNRLEAFSDGVLAIIITIMILELRQPAGDSIWDFLELGPILFAYILSFTFIAIYWVNHHLILHDAEQVNLKVLWCNIAWLFFMSFIPFCTAWAGTYPTSWAPEFLYFADMAWACITFHVMYYLIECENGNREEFRLNLRSILSLIVYIGAALFCTYNSLLAYISVAVISLWWIFPDRKNKAAE